MPTCLTCGEKEFECIDGLFYCALCQTQSQDVRVEEAEDFIEGIVKGTNFKEQKQKTDAKPKDRGRLWTTHEGFQYIILEQLNALNKLGASKDIKECVWRLWVMYLSKIGVAFTNSTEPPKKPLFLAAFPRHRDLQPNPVIKPLRLRKTRSEKQGSPIKKQEISNELENEEFYKGDNPDSEEEDADEWNILLVDNIGQTKQTQSQPLSKKRLELMAKMQKRVSVLSVERMNIKKTLAFCYLGLLFTGSISGPGDLTRWARQRKIPYFSASTSLPEDMQLGLYDKHVLDSRLVPKTADIRMDAFQIAKFLSILDKLPVPEITLIIHRHIHSLHLPAELHGLTVNLLKSKPPDLSLKEKGMMRGQHHITEYDIIAMAYIIATLKLMLGLDDNTERKLSTYARKLIDMVTLNQPLFVWEDWSQYMEKREAEKEGFCLLRNQRQIAEVRETKSLTKHLEQFSSLHGKQYKDRATSALMTKPHVRESIQQCFSLLGEKWIERGTHKPETLSKPQSESSQMEDDPIGFLVDSPKKESTNEGASSNQTSTNQVEAERNFRKSSLRYITKQENFLEELDKQGLTDFTIYSSCISSSDSQSDGEESNQSGDMFQSPLPHSPIIAPGIKKPRRKKRRRAKEAVLNALSQNSKRKRSRSFNKQDLMYNFEKAYENYRLYSGKTSETNRHQSYDWLLKLCAKTIDCTVEDLDAKTQSLQMLYFGEMSEQDHGTLSRLDHFFKAYFSTE